MLERSSKNAKRMNNKRKNIRKEKIKKIYKKIKWTNIMNFRIKNKLKNKEQSYYKIKWKIFTLIVKFLLMIKKICIKWMN